MAQSAALASQVAAIPERIDRYVIINHIGRGTTSSVYLAHDPQFQRDVAIKLYQTAPDVEDPSRAKVALKMFSNEAHMVGMLQHPNILPILDAGVDEEQYFVVMEHVQRARTLEPYCRPDNLLPLDDVVKIVYKCARALHYAHKRGVIHRDIKPQNIMLTHDNDVRIIDFGIAIVGEADFSRIEGIAGSPSYMSPEQVQSGEVQSASDLYSLGAVMYELITGFRPFRAASLGKLMNQILYATPAPIHSLRSSVPADLEEVVSIAMRKDPAARFENGAEFAVRLTRVYHQLRGRNRHHYNQEHFDLLRRSRFFHEFSHAEIRDLLRAGEWREYAAGEEIVREGELDDRFYVIVSGEVSVETQGRVLGMLTSGDCFGETGYLNGATRSASIRAREPVTVLSVSATLLEQVSTDCQLRFTKVFLRTLIQRLQGGNETRC